MPIPVISVAQMREWEKLTWAAGVTEDSVMRRAGQAVARLAEAMTQPDDLILFLAGKGHNGDDAAYAHDYVSGRRRELVRVSDPEAASQEVGVSLSRRPALVVDGLFGIGLDRPLSNAWTKLIQQINDAGLPVLAVDVPSGLNAETGVPLETAVRAAVTVTLGAPKQGLVMPTAAPYVGRLEIANEIGLIPCPFASETRCACALDYRDFPPGRPVTGHKGTFGHVLIVAGSVGYHGAAVLAARGALRAQPGLVTVFTPEPVYVSIASQLAAAMVHPIKGEIKPPDHCSAILVGPGLAAAELPGQIHRATVRLWQESQLPILVDASGLDWLPAGPTPKGALRVITPHPGEAARMLQSSTARVQGDRLSALRELSRGFGGCQVVLKGHHTLVGTEAGDVLVNCSGNPYLGQGGSGDVLAGYLAGLLAQPALQQDVQRTLSFGVWQHGAAADSLARRQSNFTVEDLAEALGSVRP